MRQDIVDIQSVGKPEMNYLETKAGESVKADFEDAPSCWSAVKPTFILVMHQNKELKLVYMWVTSVTKRTRTQTSVCCLIPM